MRRSAPSAPCSMRERRHESHQRHHQRAAISDGLRGRPGGAALKARESRELRIGTLRGKFGEIGDARLVVMAALTVCDELLDATARIRGLERGTRWAVPMDPLSEQGARPSHATVKSWPRRESRSGYRCSPLAADDRRSSLHHAWTLAVAGRSVDADADVFRKGLAANQSILRRKRAARTGLAGRRGHNSKF